MRDVHHWSTPFDYWHDTSFFPSRSVTGTRHIVLIIQLTNTPMLFSLSPQVVVRLRQCSSEHPPWAGLTLTPNPIWHIERDSGPALVQKWTDLTQCCTPHSFRAVFLSSLIISALVWSQGLGGYRLKPVSPDPKPARPHCYFHYLNPCFNTFMLWGFSESVGLFDLLLDEVSSLCPWLVFGLFRSVGWFFIKSIITWQKPVSNFSSNGNFFPYLMKLRFLNLKKMF